MNHMRVPGLKASATKLYAWGPDEHNRAARHAAWTGDHPTEPKANNPHTRDKVYSLADHQRAASFYVWRKAHPDEADSANPYAYRAHPRR
jgi:hypothetical protein